MFVHCLAEIKTKIYMYNRLPEDEPSGSKHVEYNLKINILV